jgi:tRNA(Ile)-lysidine synthase
VALSGGADSVALLHLLVDARGELEIELEAAHVHHHVRRAAADADAEFCQALCARLGVGLALLHVRELRSVGMSPEAFLRRERYRLLEATRVALGCAAVATAHTLDDQAETVLWKLVRGAGMRGVAGIRLRNGKVIRPLLGVPRAELRSLLTQKGEGWCEDLTNRDPEQPRAYLRHHVLPLLEARFPAGSAHLAAYATRVHEDEAALFGLLERCAVYPAVGEAVPLEMVRALSPALRRRWVLELAGRLPLAEPPSRQQLDLVERLLEGESPAAVDLGRHWVLRRRGGMLHLAPPACAPFRPVPARLGESQKLPGGFKVALGVAEAHGTAVTHRVILHPRLAAASAVWRPLRRGERLPGERRRAADALARLGVPPEWRFAWPVLEAGGTMIWLPGVVVAPGWGGDPESGIPAQVEEPWKRRER